MGAVALTGRDTIQVGGHVFTCFGDGDVANLTFENDIAQSVRGKNGNFVVSEDAKGGSATLVIKLILGSVDDIFLNSQLTAYRAFSPAYVLMRGNFVKLIGQGTGAILPISYRGTGGYVSKLPDANSSSDGKTDDGQVTWTVKFADVQRVM